MKLMIPTNFHFSGPGAIEDGENVSFSFFLPFTDAYEKRFVPTPAVTARRHKTTKKIDALPSPPSSPTRAARGESLYV